jgi:hypothetical protein
MQDRESVSHPDNSPDVSKGSDLIGESAINALRCVHEEFFDILMSSPLVTKIEIIARDQYRMDWSGLATSAIEQTEALFESVISFWEAHWVEVRQCLLGLPGRYVLVDQGQLLKALRKYALFFDGLLVSEQMLVTARECQIGPTPRELPGPLKMSLMAAAVYLANKDLFLPHTGRPSAFLVPAMRCVDSDVEKCCLEVSRTIAVQFMSRLLDRDFLSLEECAGYILSRSPGESDLAPDLLQHAFAYRGVTSLDDYAVRFREVLQTEQGITLPGQILPLQCVLWDVFARMSEFERFTADAYGWAQISSIPYPEDLGLYKWWARSSSRIGAKIVGLPHSEDSLFIYAAESQTLGFLKDLPLEEVLRFSAIMPAHRLRERLHFSGDTLRSMRQGAVAADFEPIGRGITNAIDSFVAEAKEDLGRANRELVLGLAGIGVSLTMLIASQAFPPLSVLSILGGGSLAGLIDAVRRRRQILISDRTRAIATLCAWRERRGGQ